MKGYPTTDDPATPEILKYAVEFEVISEPKKTGLLAFTLAHEGADLVSTKSLEIIRNRLLRWYRTQDEIIEELEDPLPNNVIAISCARANFYVGESCQEFKLAKHIEKPKGSYFTYRKLSECAQITVFNANGIEHMAGICFYPTPHGKPKFLRSNEALAYFALTTHPIFPLRDRRISYKTQNKANHGRFCKSAGRKVLVLIKPADGIPRHQEFNHDTKKYFYELCKECAEDYFTYKWEEPKKAIQMDSEEPKSTDAPSIDTSTVVSKQLPESELPSSPPSEDSVSESLLEEFEHVNITTDSELDVVLVN